MERRLLRVFLIRLAIFALPFGVYFVWREWARRSGREMASTPWPWLVAAGALLAGLTLIGGVVLHRGPDTGTYVPAEARADGAVTPGRFITPDASSPGKAYPGKPGR